MKKYIWIWLGVISLSMSSIHAQEPENHTKQFTLYIFLLDECIICQQYAPLLNSYYDTYKENVEFVGLFPNFASKLKGISSFRKKYDVQYPLKTDHYKRQASKYNVKVTPEVVLVDNQNNQVVYQGRIDNGYVRIGKRRRVVTSHELQKALESARLDNSSWPISTEAIGCFINFKERNH